MERPSAPAEPAERRLLYTALHQAVLDCRFHQVRLLVEKCSADVDSRDMFGRSALMLCSLLEEEALGLRMVKIILKHGSANLGLKDHLGRTALIYACLHARESIVLALLKADIADVEEPDNDGNTALHHAAVHGTPAMVRALVESHRAFGSSLDPRNSLGFTPLLLACKYRSFHAAALILSRSPGSANLRENQTYRNALEWLRVADRLFLRSQRRRKLPGRFDPDAPSPPPSPAPPQPPVRMNASAQMRPTFLTERTATSLTNFYKEITSPVLRDARASADFHGLVALPHLPSSAFKFIGVTAPSRPEETRPTSQASSELSLPDFLAMGEDAVREWVLTFLEHKELPRPTDSARSAPVPTGSRKGRAHFSLSRPITQELRRGAPRGGRTARDCLPMMFRIYCDSINAPTAADTEEHDGIARLCAEDGPSANKRTSVVAKSFPGGKPKAK